MKTQVREPRNPLLNRKEASRELAALGIRRAPSTLAKIFSTRADGPPCVHIGRTPYYPKDELHNWARRQITSLRSSSREPRREGEWIDSLSYQRTQTLHESDACGVGPGIRRSERV